MYGVFDLPLFDCFVQINIQVSYTKSIASLSCDFIHISRFVKLLNHRSGNKCSKRCTFEWRIQRWAVFFVPSNHNATVINRLMCIPAISANQAWPTILQVCSMCLWLYGNNTISEYPVTTNPTPLFFFLHATLTTQNEVKCCWHVKLAYDWNNWMW